MTISEFADLVLDGIHPVIEFKKGIVEEFEQYAETGMRARVNGVVLKHNYELAYFSVDFNEFEAFNQLFETANYYDKDGNTGLTARQAGRYTSQDSYAFDLKNTVDLYFEVVEDTSLKLYDRYKKSGATESYVQWLESIAAPEFGLWFSKPKDAK